MRQRDRESVTDSEAHDGLFFGSGDDDSDSRYDDTHYDDAHYGDGRQDDQWDGDDARPRPVPRSGSRLEARRRSNRRRRRGVLGAVIAFFVVVIVAAAVLIGIPAYRYFNPSDYDGAGSGSVVVTVHANDDATTIGATLADNGVVASRRAFTDAAADNAKSLNIQPGSYRLHEHMSAAAAIGLLLDPSSRVNSDVVVTEGATVFDIQRRLTAARCTASSAQDTICGLGLPKTAVAKALRDVTALGVPTEFTAGSKSPSSAEGFLYPATYAFDDTTDADAALQAMVGKFTDEARATDFTARAKTLGLTPYQELIIASMAQSEAKYPADMAKVARVILNRIAANQYLKIDAASVYGAKVQGLDPSKVTYSTLSSPYNTYLHSGLPPTPISNPGEQAMNAAAHPTAGNWLFYVNGDAAGHLFFTHSETEFTKAVARCQQNNWGC